MSEKEQGLEVVAHLQKPKRGCYAGVAFAHTGEPEHVSKLFDYERLVRQADAERVIDHLRAEVEMLRRDRRACLEEFKALRRSADEAERELRAEVESLRSLLAECADYLNTNELTSIGHGSILHRKMIDAAMVAKETNP